MSTRQSTDARALNHERRTAERERSRERRTARCAKHFHGDDRYTARGRLAG